MSYFIFLFFYFYSELPLCVLCFSLVMLCYVMLSTETTTGFKLLEYFDLQRYPAQMCTLCFTLTDCFKDRLVEGAY